MIETLRNIVFVFGLLVAIITAGWNWIARPAMAYFIDENVKLKVNKRLEKLEALTEQLEINTNAIKLEIIELKSGQEIQNLKTEQILELLRSRLAPMPNEQ